MESREVSFHDLAGKPAQENEIRSLALPLMPTHDCAQQSLAGKRIETVKEVAKRSNRTPIRSLAASFFLPKSERDNARFCLFTTRVEIPATSEHGRISIYPRWALSNAQDLA